MGIVVRNLSNGLSFVDPAIPDNIRRDVIAGIVYQREISNINVRPGLDVHPLSVMVSEPISEAEVWYRDRIGGRIGYLRDTEKRYASVILLEDNTFEMEERTWKTEGLCLGFGVRVANITLNAAYTPQFKPTVSENERIHSSKAFCLHLFNWTGFLIGCHCIDIGFENVYCMRILSKNVLVIHADVVSRYYATYKLCQMSTKQLSESLPLNMS